MAERDHIRNPAEWGADQLKLAGAMIGEASHSLAGSEPARDTAPPQVRRIGLADLRQVLRQGVEDFGACRSDVMFLCIIYPLAGLLLGWTALNHRFLPLVFPMVTGFALLGPLAALGLYEISRRREAGLSTSWADAFGVLRSPAIGAIVVLGCGLLAVFLLWLAAAYKIFEITLGPDEPLSVGAFVGEALGTGEGWTMILLGCGVGFLFALLVLTLTVVSFPMLLDRDVGLFRALATSAQAVATNPVPMAAWGLIVAAGLVLGSIPVLLGLVIVMPVLGHATWHLYRRLVP